MNKNNMLLKYIFFFIGIIILSFGVALVIRADLGVSAWDVLHIGLYHTLGLTIGTWSQIVGFTVIIITFFLDRTFIAIGTILNMIFVGMFIDLFLKILPTINSIVLQLILLLIGTFFMAFGAGLYITSKLGPGPRDGLLLALSKKITFSIGKIKTTMELIALLLGWLLGGPVYIGTVLVSVIIGPIMQFSIAWWDKKLKPILNNNDRIFLKDQNEQL